MEKYSLVREKGIVIRTVDPGRALDPVPEIETGRAADSTISVIDLVLDHALVLRKGIDITAPVAMETEAIVIVIDARPDKNYSESLCTYLG